VWYRILSNLFTCLSLAVLLVSCATEPTELKVEPDAWEYEKRGIEISIKAPSDLNSLSGRPHSLALGVFQLNDPNTFSGLAQTREGAVELLQKGRIDDTVSNFTLINIRPGERKNVTLNRAQAAQYVGVIAGYYALNPTNDVKVFPIPLKALSRGMVEGALVKLSLMADEANAVPDKLSFVVELGRSSSKQIRIFDQALIKEDKPVDVSTEASINWFEKLNSVPAKK
jgi:type VI secretion system VasD/TssJ family lipoprotein